jgi:hypothetical protein
VRATTNSPSILNKEELYDRVKVCEELAPSSPEVPDLQTVNTNKEYYKYVYIGAMKITLTFKLEKKEVNFDPKMGFGAFTVLYSILAGVLTISDSPIKFREQLMENIFSS